MMHPFDAFFETIEHDQLEKAAELIAGGFDIHVVTPSLFDEDATTPNRTSLLQLAIRYQDTYPDSSMVRLLVESGANLHYRDEYDNTCVYDAIRNNLAATLKYLLQAGADPYAIKKGDTDAIDSSQDFAVTPMSYAIDRGSMECRQCLHEWGVGFDIPKDRPADIRAIFKEPLFITACHHYSPGPLAYLLDHHDFDLDAKNRFGQTALMIALDEGFLEHAILLLKKGASLEPTSPQGQTVLQQAIETKSPLFITLFESHLLATVTEPSLPPSTAFFTKRSQKL